MKAKEILKVLEKYPPIIHLEHRIDTRVDDIKSLVSELGDMGYNVYNTYGDKSEIKSIHTVFGNFGVKEIDLSERLDLIEKVKKINEMVVPAMNGPIAMPKGLTEDNSNQQ